MERQASALGSDESGHLAIDSLEAIARDVRAIERIDAVRPMLRVLCDVTGMGFAAVARVTEGTWTACAVQDDIKFGLEAGGQLPLESTLCNEVRHARTPIVIDQASVDTRYCTHHTPRIYGIESYISVPIVLPDGEYFGNLCAIDPRPAKVSQPHIVSMFTLFAQLIAVNLENDRKFARERAALLDERAAGELREEFIAILGHDLRNPLAAVAACGQLLQRQSTDPDAVATTVRLMRNVRRMSALIDDVLDFARGRLGSGIRVTMAEVEDIEPVLAAVLTEFRDSHPGRRIDSRIEARGRVHCDPARVQQVASNLLANALAHGAEHGEIRLAARIENGMFVLQVWNQGEPIAPDSIDKVFQPFWRRSISGAREGLGLGLYICAQIVAAQNGTIDVTSTREAGTMFTVRWPLALSTFV